MTYDAYFIIFQWYAGSIAAGFFTAMLIILIRSIFNRHTL